MRKIDEAKKAAITQAVFLITYKEGITNLSIAKIARQVGVSKATMYVYYHDKTDMLGKIFLEVKQLLDDGLDQAIQDDEPFKERLKTVLTHFANRFVEYPYETNFMRAILANPDLVEPEVIEQSQNMAKPLFDLFAEGVKDNHWLSDDIQIVGSILMSPIFQYTEIYFNQGRTVPKSKLDELIDILISTNVAE